jgi:cytochrome c-type biogenesis protein CcmH
MRAQAPRRKSGIPMLIFWLGAALMIAVALALILPSLLGRYRADNDTGADASAALFRDRLAILESERREGELAEDDYREARLELERELLTEVDETRREPTRTAAGTPLVAVMVAVFVPLMAFGVYLQTGTPQALKAPSNTAASRTADTPVAGAAADGQMPHSLEEMLARLEARLARNPGDADGWVMLGRSYAAFNRLQEAQQAFRKADRLRPDHPLTLVAHAETLAGLQGNRLDGEPERLIRRALSIAPDFPRALWLAGMAEFRGGKHAAAAATWQRLLDRGGLNEEQTRQVQQAVATAEAAPTTPAPRVAAGATTDRSSTAPTLSVHVAIAPELAARTAPTDVLYVFARAEQGPPMPLAVSRHTVAELPLAVILDDSMAMAPGLRLSMFPAVVVAARVSKSGSPTPTPGDLLGRSAPLAPSGKTSVSVLIDRVVP